MGLFGAILGGIVGFFVGGPVGAVIGAGLGATKVGETIINKAMDFVLSPFMPKMPDVNAASGEEQIKGVLLQRTGSNVDIPVVYGYKKVGGAVTFVESGGTGNKYLFVAYIFSEGVVEGLHEVYVDDVLLPINKIPNLNVGETVTITEGRYANRMTLMWRPGAWFDLSTPAGQAQNRTQGTANKTFFAESVSFKDTMTYNGLATMFVRYEWKETTGQTEAETNPFGGSEPKMQVAVLGKRVTSLTYDGVENLEYDTVQSNATLTRYSTNPAECLLDYLRNPRYGKGLKNADIDWTSWKIAARKCNTPVYYLNNETIPQGPILTLNMAVQTSQTLMSNVKDILFNFRGYMPYVQGKYKLKIEDAGNPTDILSGAATIAQTFTKDDIVSNISYKGIDRSAKYNVVTVTYTDPDQKWSPQSVVYPESESDRQRYITIDGGRENKYDTTMAGITNYGMAKDFARLIFNKQRRQESCSFTATSKALELEPGDCIRIQSNLLNFGTDPWRIISMQVNNDMTVELGCVRNPDDMYPYTRVGEEDIVLPTYTPKGSIIYYPTSDNRYPLGLVPPVYAVTPPNTAPTPSYPGSTDPTSPAGGGVGGGTPSNGGSTGGGTVPPVNNISPNTPVVVAFNALLTLKSSRAEAIGNGNFNFNIVFAQPQDALYSYAKVWWRYNRYSPWSEVLLQTKPGPGGDIPWVLSNLGYGSYEYYVRAYASDNRSSGFVLQGQISFPQNVAELNPALTGIASALSLQVADGWTLPASQVATTPRYNDIIDEFNISPKAGSPLNPRRLTVTIKQNSNTLVNTPNNLIKGVRIYYKFNTDTYYSYEDFVFNSLSSTYGPGVQLSFNLAGDFGTPGSGDALQRYTFLARLTYQDGVAATKQIGPGIGLVESFTGQTTGYVVFGTDVRSSGGRFLSVDIPSGFSLLTVDQDPNKAFAAGSEIIPNIFSISSAYVTPVLTWYFTPPTSSASKWRGYKIRYREVIPGTNTAFTEVPVGTTVDPVSGKVSVVINGGTFKLNTYYDWLVTAQYTTGAATADATTSLACRASILQNIGYTYSNLTNTVFAWTQVDTKTALNQLLTTFPALPTPQPVKWIKRQFSQSTNGQLPGYLATRKTDGNYALASYYQFKFQMPNDTFDAVIVYRRVRDTLGEARTTTSATTAKYFGLGIWEKVIVTRASMTKGADGLYTLNVRGPIDPKVFDSYYQVSGFSTRTLFDAKYASTGYFPDNKTSGYMQNVYPYYGVGNTDFSSPNNTKWVEFLFSIKDVGTESTKALRLKDFYTTTSGTGFTQDVDGFLTGNISKADVVTLSDFNPYTAGYSRNLNEAIPNSSYIYLQYLNYGGYGTFNPYFTSVPNTSGNSYVGPATVYLVQPLNGDIVW